MERMTIKQEVVIQSCREFYHSFIENLRRPKIITHTSTNRLHIVFCILSSNYEQLRSQTLVHVLAVVNHLCLAV